MRTYVDGWIHALAANIVLIGVVSCIFAVLGLLTFSATLILATVSCLSWLASFALWLFWG